MIIIIIIIIRLSDHVEFLIWSLRSISLNWWNSDEIGRGRCGNHFRLLKPLWRSGWRWHFCFLLPIESFQVRFHSRDKHSDGLTHHRWTKAIVAPAIPPRLPSIWLIFQKEVLKFFDIDLQPSAKLNWRKRPDFISQSNWNGRLSISAVDCP